MIYFDVKAFRFRDSDSGLFVKRKRGYKPYSYYRKKPRKPIEKVYIEKEPEIEDEAKDKYKKYMNQVIRKVEKKFQFQDKKNKYFYSKRKKKHTKVRAFYICNDPEKGDSIFDFVFLMFKKPRDTKQTKKYLEKTGRDVMNNRILEASNVKNNTNYTIKSLQFFHDVK